MSVLGYLNFLIVLLPDYSKVVMLYFVDMEGLGLSL